MLSDFDPLIEAAATKFGLSSKVIRAVILTESLANPWSFRTELAYAYTVHPREWADKLLITYNSELQFQMTSIGLMHPMGAVCREYGFDRMLSEIFKPDLSILYGCTHLKKKAEKYGDDPATLYAAYNAGSPRKTEGGMWINQLSVDRFMRNFNAL